MLWHSTDRIISPCMSRGAKGQPPHLKQIARYTVTGDSCSLRQAPLVKGWPKNNAHVDARTHQCLDAEPYFSEIRSTVQRKGHFIMWLHAARVREDKPISWPVFHPPGKEQPPTPTRTDAPHLHAAAAPPSAAIGPGGAGAALPWRRRGRVLPPCSRAFEQASEC